MKMIFPRQARGTFREKKAVFKCSMSCHSKEAQMDHALTVLQSLLIRKGIQA